MNHLIMITKSDGTKQLFEEEKLVNSLKRAGASDTDIDNVLEKIESHMKDGMTTSEIYSHAFSLLHKHSFRTAIKYSLRRALAELGPDGFPFEKLIARIFHAWGYETITDQHVMGACIEHEIDVVAWKDKTLAMVEAKFHNEFGMKSDVKVALYIKARFDDIAQNEFDFGGVRRKLSERWLFTNTKFTDQAIKYASCNDLRLVGWNYPTIGNLHNLIENLGLHPITCLNSINHQQKNDLIGRNIVTCAGLIKRPEILKEIGIHSQEDMTKILDESKMVIGGGR